MKKLNRVITDEDIEHKGFPFECENCGNKPTPQKVINHSGWCEICGDNIVSYTVDAAEYILSHCTGRKENEMNIKCSVCKTKDAVNESVNNPGTYYCPSCANYICMEYGYNYLKPIQLKDTAPLLSTNEYPDADLEPIPEFCPKYFTGLPQDVERAKKYIGCKMEFSDNGREWFATTLEGISAIDAINPYRTDRKDYDSEWFMFCRTCPETFKPETRYIQFGPGQIHAPETEEPEKGTFYFYINTLYKDGYRKTIWRNDNVDKSAFKNGLYLEEEHAKEAVSVIRGIMGRAG